MRYILLLLLASCSTPEIVYKPSQVDVPVSVPCKVPQISQPVWATASVSQSDALFKEVKALVVENEQRKQFEQTLIAANKACQ